MNEDDPRAWEKRQKLKRKRNVVIWTRVENERVRRKSFLKRTWTFKEVIWSWMLVIKIERTWVKALWMRIFSLITLINYKGNLQRKYQSKLNLQERRVNWRMGP